MCASISVMTHSPNTDLFEQLTSQLSPDNIWPTKEFTTAKIEEKRRRYLKFNETAYNLEPNIKEGPGGLRDIQIIGWVAKRHFNVDSLKQLIGHNFLTSREYEQLKHGQSFLWKIRFALHILCKRHEERLLFDYQRELAAQFGYTDQEGKLAVECFMTEYYQTVMELERLNEMLLQYFQEVIIYSDSDSKPQKINRRFINYKGYIAAANQFVFRNYPFALLEINTHRHVKNTCWPNLNARCLFSVSFSTTLTTNFFCLTCDFRYENRRSVSGAHFWGDAEEERYDHCLFLPTESEHHVHLYADSAFS